MKKILLLACTSISAIIFLYGLSFPVENKPLQIKKQPEIQQIKPKKPVKIKVKRSPEGKYTWELAGDDVDEIVRVDKRLKKLLVVE